MDVVNAKVTHLVNPFPSQVHLAWFDPSAFLAIMRVRGIELNAPSGYAEGFTMPKASLMTTVPGQEGGVDHGQRG